MKISVVIRCYNEERLIGRLLDGVLQQALPNVEIIVVDSGSTDATLSIVARYPVKLLSIRPEEFSFGRSLNKGCRSASGDIIVIASAHVYPMYQDWLERLVAPFADPQVALVYGKQRGSKTTKYSEHQLFFKWFPDQSDFNQNQPFCNNANAAIRRRLWQTLNYDESLTGLEDTDWARRAMQLGHKIVYAADAEVVHVHEESLKQIYNRYRREAIAMKRIFPQERFGLSDFVRLIVANTVSDYRHAQQDRALWSNFYSIFAFRLMQFWGTYRGFGRRGPVTSQLKRAFYYPNHRAGAESAADRSELRRPVEYAENPAERQREKPQ